MTNEPSAGDRQSWNGDWIPNSPQVGLRWLPLVSGEYPSWLTDEQWVPPGDHALYRRAKDGFREVIADLDDEGPVLLPAYVPAGLPATVEAAGHEVAYYPVDDALEIRAGVVTDLLETLDPVAMVFVHFFGFADPAYRTLGQRANDVGVFVIEDAARGLFGRDDEGILLGSTGDAAIFCPHKTLPAPNGGLLVRRRGQPRPAEARCPEWFEPLTGLVGRFVGARRPISKPESTSPTTVPTGVSATESCEPGWVSRRGLNRIQPETVQTERLRRYRSLRTQLVDEVPVVTPTAGEGAAPYGVG
ncbi:MAG: DegT/DnrJ/EryC1/StrS family aminotransferase, partial [archaeon]